MKKYFLCFLFVIISLLTNLYAQDYNNIGKRISTLSLHPRVGVAFNLHAADFNFFKGMADCGTFKNSSSLGLSAGIALEKHFSENTLFSLGFNYISRSTVFENTSSYPMRDENLNITNITTISSLDIVLDFFEIQPDFRYTILKDFLGGPFKAVAGIRMILPLTNSFEQTENIAEPANAVFISTNTRTRTISKGDIHTLSGFWFGIAVGFENLIRIGNINITQQFLIDYNFDDVVSDSNWKILGFRFEIGVPIILYKYNNDSEDNKDIIPDIMN